MARTEQKMELFKELGVPQPCWPYRCFKSARRTEGGRSGTTSTTSRPSVSVIGRSYFLSRPFRFGCPGHRHDTRPPEDPFPRAAQAGGTG